MAGLSKRTMTRQTTTHRYLVPALIPLYAVILMVINGHVKGPYMDEIFHVKQTQAYCKGQWFTWDPKITTFPGLYFLGAGASFLTSALEMLVDGSGRLSTHACSTAMLRAVNVVLSLACIPVFYSLVSSLNQRSSPRQRVLMTLACVLFPLHFFYAFLYYTDVASTLCILSSWLAIRQDGPRGKYISGILSVFAILMRQTNAVWVAFVLAHTALTVCTSSSSSSVAVLSEAWRLRRTMISGFWPLMIPVISFAVFVVWNKGIVVGDKAHHAPVLHWMQPLYCAAYCALCMAPALWTGFPFIRNYNSRMKIKRIIPKLSLSSVALVIGITLCVRYGSLVHPFLLADNRHFTFYIWRRLINRSSWSRYALIPGYVYSLYFLNTQLSESNQSKLHRLLLAGATATVLIPAELLEFRYFTVPFYFIFLLMKPPSTSQLGGMVLLFVFVNVVTLTAFITRPFQWGDGSEARFMW